MAAEIVTIVPQGKRTWRAAAAACAVIATPDLERRVLLPGVERSSETAKHLQDQVKATIAPCEYPRSLVFVDRLPKTAAGKI